jgi:hypothetical protein
MFRFNLLTQTRALTRTHAYTVHMHIQYSSSFPVHKILLKLISYIKTVDSIGPFFINPIGKKSPINVSANTRILTPVIFVPKMQLTLS